MEGSGKRGLKRRETTVSRQGDGIADNPGNSKMMTDILRRDINEQHDVAFGKDQDENQEIVDLRDRESEGNESTRS